MVEKEVTIKVTTEADASQVEDLADVLDTTKSKADETGQALQEAFEEATNRVEELTDELANIEMGESDADFDREHYRHEGVTIKSLFEEDKAVLLPLPEIDFDCSRYESARTDKWGRFTLDDGKHEYSASPEAASDVVWLRITSDKVFVMDMEHNPIVTHRRLYGDHKQSSMEWLPYLTAISRKPRSLFNSGIFEMMPESMQEYMKSCSNTDRGKVLKILAEQTKRTGFDSALQTVKQALVYQATDPDSLQNLYRRIYSDVPVLPPLPSQKGVPDIIQMPIDLSAYDTALRKGGAMNG